MLKDNNFVGFYHENEEYGCFSNWYMSEFEYAGKNYSNSEQYMMFQKARLFSKYDLADKILQTTDPQECKNLARVHFDNWDEFFWKRVRYTTVKRGIKAKFVQNPEIRGILLDTGDKLLAECSPNDAIWGIKIGIDDERRFDITQWDGENLLGRILMEVRDELRTASSGQLIYQDAKDQPAISEWDMTIGELMRIPKYRKAIMPYYETVRFICGDDTAKYMKDECIPSSMEDSQRNNMGGGFPPQGFWEMKQEIYDLAALSV